MRHEPKGLTLRRPVSMAKAWGGIKLRKRCIEIAPASTYAPKHRCTKKAVDGPYCWHHARVHQYDNQN